MLLLAAWPALAQSQQTLKLVDGGVVVGRIVSAKDQYLQVALDSGGGAPVYTNVYWVRMSQETLRELATNRTAMAYANIFLDPPVRERTVARPRNINIKQPPRLDRPQAGSLAASPVMVVVLLLIWAANVWAGWEVGIYRQWPAAMTAAVAAFVPIIGPIIFLAMPTHRPKEEAPIETAPVLEEAPPPVEEAPAAPVEQAPAQPAAPQIITFARGQFTFNRRFFETKFAGFLKMVPGEAERDKVLYFKTARGEYTGHRLSKVEPNELYLQIRKGTATEDVMIPYTEIYEVQIKPAGA